MSSNGSSDSAQPGERSASLEGALERLDLLIKAAVQADEDRQGKSSPDNLFPGLVISKEEFARLLMEKQAEDQAASRPPAPPQRRGFLFFRPRTEPATPRPPLTEKAARPKRPTPAELPPIPLDHPGFGWLDRTYPLTPFDLDVILIALAPEVDLRYERLYAYLQDDVTRKRPTVDLALKLLCAAPEERLEQRGRFGPEAPLVRERLVHLIPDPNQSEPPLLANFLKLDEQIVDILLRQSGLDRRLVNFCELVEPAVTLDDLLLEDDTRRALVEVVRLVRAEDRPLPLYFQGPRGAGLRQAAEGLAGALEAKLLEVDLVKAMGEAMGFEEAVRLVLREADLHSALIYFDHLDVLRLDEYALTCAALMDLLAGYSGVQILSGAGAWVPPVSGLSGTLTIPFPIPGFTARKQAWELLLAEAGLELPAADLDALAGRFRLTGRQISDAIASAENLRLLDEAKQAQAADTANAADASIDPSADPSARPILRELFASARQQAGHELSGLANKIFPQYHWKDIVLPDDAITQLHELCQRVVYRARVLEDWEFSKKLSYGRGVSALFSGPPGTGKTMAAEIIANDLNLDLYKINLATVVDKYIGVTEKNLERIFTAAENANVILFFDEADVLFSKRMEVRDAHDRYANLEVGFLLQRMETYDGVVILASNMRQNIDDAFTRRMQFIVDFPFPDEAYRRRIWQILFPEQAPRGADLDFDYLAREFRLSGANILSALLAAAYLAAAEHSPIAMRHLLHAIRREMLKMGKILPESEYQINPVSPVKA